MSIIGDGIMLGAGGESASIFVTGLSETDTVTATKDGKTITGKWTQKLNPASVVLDGYTQLEYIESTGTQCINTELAENSVYGIRMKFAVPSLVTTYQSLVSGTLDTGFTVGSTTKTTGLYVRLRGDEVLNNDTALSSSVNELVIKDGKISINGAQVATYTAGALSSGSGQLYVFNNNTKSRYSNMFLYELELYDNSGATVRDYVQAKRNSDSAIGMYDLVSNTFYANSGTGTFTAGAEVPQTIDGFLIDKIKSYGTWTVSNGDGTKAADVLIDAAAEFEVTL